MHGEVDDIQPCAAYGYPYERWANDVVAHMESPSSGWIGRNAEVLMDAVDLDYLYPNGSQQVTAVVTNCHEDAIQPKFVLPIVRERVIDVKVFVTTKDGKAILSRADVMGKMDHANEVFRQVGVRFNLAAVETLPDSERFSRLTGIYEEESYMLFWKRQLLTRQVSDLLNSYQRMPNYSGNDCIEAVVDRRGNKRMMFSSLFLGAALVVASPTNAPAVFSTETVGLDENGKRV